MQAKRVNKVNGENENGNTSNEIKPSSKDVVHIYDISLEANAYSSTLLLYKNGGKGVNIRWRLEDLQF